MALRTDRNLHLLFASLLLWMFGIALYEHLIPIHARNLGASAVELGTLFTLRHLGLAVGFLIGWAVVDRLSRRTLMVASWLLGVPVPLMLAAAPTYLWLLPGLLLYELTYFGLPAIQAYVADRVPAGERASAYGIMGTITSVGFLVSPTAGGAMADRWGIPTVLVVASVLFLLSAILIFRVQHSGPGTMPAAGSARLSWQDVRPLLPVLAFYAGTQLVVYLTVPFLAPFLREVRRLSLAEIGVLGSMVAVGAVALTPVAGRLGDRFGTAPVLAGQLVVFAMGILLTVLGPAALLPLFAVLRCRAPLNALAQAMIGARAPSAIVGRTFSIAGMLSALLAAFGSFVGGFAYRADPALPLYLSAGLAITLGVALLRGTGSAASLPADARPAADPPEAGEP
ncbi:MAG: MFS transporter [Armatimonadota bacterium]|nr:MFS transporter [Armatimonadota bacterium]